MQGPRLQEGGAVEKGEAGGHYDTVDAGICEYERKGGLDESKEKEKDCTALFIGKINSIKTSDWDKIFRTHLTHAVRRRSDARAGVVRSTAVPHAGSGYTT